MKKLSVILAVFLAAATLSAQDKTYFVSAQGNDSADGLSVATAWKSIEKVNSVTFLPGDRILFRKGDTFYGQIAVKGSGEEGRPITMSSYGDGSGRPVINLGSAEGAGILMENVSHWEVYGMEVVSYEPYKIGIGRQGIVVRVSDGGSFDHFVIKDNYVHDIWGQLGGNGLYVNYSSSAILVHTARQASGRAVTGPNEPTVINDVLIEGNRIERVDKCGIVCRGARNNVVVRGNYMDNIGGDGIFVNGPYRGLIEYNEIHRSCMRAGFPDLPGDDGWWPHVAACWIQNTEETIMQFNEVYDTARNLYNGDGFAYDFDFNCKRCICQYNYSKNNHGLMLLMYNIFENVTRYNISENDHTHLIQMQGPLEGDNSLVYNNVFYVDYGLADIDFFLTREPELLGAKFYNNIFYATGQGRFRTVYSSGDTQVRNYDEELKPDLAPGTLFLHNCYFGPWKNGLPDDPEALVADPKFVAPGTGGTGLATLGGYKLREDSPCINTGMYVPDNGGRDFFGQSLEDGHTDYGAFEFLGSGAFADKAELARRDEASRQASSVAWAKWMFPQSVSFTDPSQIVISLREPLTDDIKGTLTWTNPKNGKAVKADISKLKDRQRLVIPVKSDAQTLSGTVLTIDLGNGAYTEHWDIPVQQAQQRRQR
ncbi:MAG: right-handed parallel beta-helix repeat-containing protein [Bacteroidales bacterium]|nr:right-handed parallel beta-helix repeat-containing protein [Bacteroidales bacterium]